MSEHQEKIEIVMKKIVGLTSYTWNCNTNLGWGDKLLKQKCVSPFRQRSFINLVYMGRVIKLSKAFTQSLVRSVLADCLHQKFKLPLQRVSLALPVICLKWNCVKSAVKPSQEEPGWGMTLGPNSASQSQNYDHILHKSITSIKGQVL